MTEDLINRICNAHGGLDLWRRVESIELQLDIFGPVLITRFKSPWLSGIVANVFTDRPYVSFHNFPEEGHTGIFDGYDVYIYNTNDQIYTERNFQDARDLKSKPRLHWDHLDMIYFLGYALWNSSCSPYIFNNKGFECHQGDDSYAQDGSVLSTLHVRFPSHIPTHSKHQVFFFDQQGLLSRNDYSADFISPVGAGSHFSRDYRQVDGLSFATRRTLFPRLWNGTPLKPLKVMEGRLKNILINWHEHPRPV